MASEFLHEERNSFVSTERGIVWTLRKNKNFFTGIRERLLGNHDGPAEFRAKQLIKQLVQGSERDNESPIHRVS